MRSHIGGRTARLAWAAPIRKLAALGVLISCGFAPAHAMIPVVLSGGSL